MTVLPGSLDYLYYNGILDHIPYEAYGSVAGAANYQMNGSQYLQQAQQGQMYNTYSAPDSFIKASNANSHQGQNNSFMKTAYGYNDGVGADYNFERTALGDDGVAIKNSIANGAKNTVSAVSNAPTFVKGLLAGGIMIGTLVALLKGKKKPTVAKTTESGSWSKFWSKINIFKKKK